MAQFGANNLLTNIATNANTCKIHIAEDNFFAKWFETSVNTTQTCFDTVGSLSTSDISKCVQANGRIAQLFSPQSMAHFAPFTATELINIQTCATSLTTADKELAWSVANAFLRRFLACDTSDMTDQQKEDAKTLLTRDQASVVSLRSVCITLHEGETLYQAAIAAMLDNANNMMRLFSQDRR